MLATLVRVPTKAILGDSCNARRYSGHYIYDHEASAEEKKRILGDTVQEKARSGFRLMAALELRPTHLRSDSPLFD